MYSTKGFLFLELDFSNLMTMPSPSYAYWKPHWTKPNFAHQSCQQSPDLREENVETAQHIQQLRITTLSKASTFRQSMKTCKMKNMNMVHILTDGKYISKQMFIMTE